MSNAENTTATAETPKPVITDRIIISHDNFPTESLMIDDKLSYSQDKLGVRQVSSFTGELEKGFNLAVVPYMDAAKYGYVKGKSDVSEKIVAYVTAPIPSLELLLSSDEGRDFVEKSVNSQLIAKLLLPIRQTLDGRVNKITGDLLDSIQLPTTLADFIERKRGKFDLEAWKTYGAKFCTLLKERKKFIVSPAKLREYFSSTAAAKKDYPAVPQQIWETLIMQLITVAKANKYDVSLFEHWLLTRDQEELTKGNETLDLDGLFEDGFEAAAE